MTVDATVLICSRNRPALLGLAVDSVLASDPAPAEVVVVDQTTTPHDALSVDPPPTVQYLHRPGSGLARARNIGFRHATHPVVAIVDDDMTVDVSWLVSLIDAIDSPTTVTTGRVLAAPLEPGQVALPDAALITLDQPAEFRGPQDRDVVPGASLALPRDLVLGVGGYDERFGAGTVLGSAEDNDLGLRLLAAGAVVRHVPDAVAWHRGRESDHDDRRIRTAYGTGKGALLAKHVRDGHLVRRLLRDAVTRVLRLARNGWRDAEVRARDATYLRGFAIGVVRWWFGGCWRRPPTQSDADR